MEWLFGGAKEHDEAKIEPKLSASASRGSSAPSVKDESWHKQRGNEHFKRKEYEAAVQEYSLGLQLQPSATLFSNRSAAYCALGLYRQALEDADAAIALDSNWAKTYSRKAKALYGLQLYQRAADAYAKGLEICLNGALGEANQREAELQALRRQTDSQADAYMRLLEENRQLKRQVEDYQHMFGDWAKKAM